MIAILLILMFVWIAESIGDTIFTLITQGDFRSLERLVYGAALGLGVASYGVFLLGICGLLYWYTVTIWWGILAALSIRRQLTQLRDLRTWITKQTRGLSERRMSGVFVNKTQLVCSCILICCGVLCVLACYKPPGSLEWDVLSYHLADPKVFIQEHRISSLRYEHHSNFPFTMEMLFTVGLLFDGYALANFFHLATAVLTVGGIIAFSSRVYSKSGGYVAAVIFASTPLVLWEASVAYVDLASALFGSLSIFAAISAMNLASSTDSTTDSTTDSKSEVGSKSDPIQTYSWIVLAGIMMGFALGVKYLALVPFGLLACYLVWRRAPVRLIALYIGIALCVGSPWYIKNTFLTHNPVYPFYYKVFPLSRDWSEDREIAYHSEQDRFGSSHSLRYPRIALLNLVSIPWQLLSDDHKIDSAIGSDGTNAQIKAIVRADTEPSGYFNSGEVAFTIQIGGVYAALCLSLLLLTPRPRVITDLLALAVLQLIAWFFMAQVGRYLIQLLPLFAVLSGYSVWRIWQGVSGNKFLDRSLQSVTTLVVAGHLLYVAWSLCALPSGGAEAREWTAKTGLFATALSFPESLSSLLRPGERTSMLEHRLDVYNADQWINQNTPPNSKIVLYDETRGFYLDRLYLWGNSNHSAFIPYPQLRDGVGLTQWLSKRGYGYALLNLNWSSKNLDHHHMSDEEAPLRIQDWFIDSGQSQGEWMFEVGDAIRRGLWTEVTVQHGVVVYKIGDR